MIQIKTDMLTMNIKGMVNLNNILTGPSTSDAIQKKERTIKSDNAQERDANGQEFYSKQKKKIKMSKEQFDKALTLLNEKSFMKEMNWIAFASIEGDFFYAEVKSTTGEVIRRMSEFDLWEVFDNPDVNNHKGQLLKRTA